MPSRYDSMVSQPTPPPGTSERPEAPPPDPKAGEGEATTTHQAGLGTDPSSVGCYRCRPRSYRVRVPPPRRGGDGAGLRPTQEAEGPSEVPGLDASPEEEEGHVRRRPPRMKILGRLFGQGPGLPITFVPENYEDHCIFDPEGEVVEVEVRLPDGYTDVPANGALIAAEIDRLSRAPKT